MICELFPYSISWLPAFKMFADHRYANIKRNVSYAEFAPGVFRCSFFYEIFTNFRNFRSKLSLFKGKLVFPCFCCLLARLLTTMFSKNSNMVHQQLKFHVDMFMLQPYFGRWSKTKHLATDVNYYF